jgi:hypothetical protein
VTDPVDGDVGWQLPDYPVSRYNSRLISRLSNSDTGSERIFLFQSATQSITFRDLLANRRRAMSMTRMSTYFLPATESFAT